MAPADPRGRAELWRWLSWYTAHIQPSMAMVAVERFIKPNMMGQPGDEHVAAYAERELVRFVPVLEQHLEGREYVLATYSIADICLGCGFQGAGRVGIDLQIYPAISAWLARIGARDAWKRAAI